MTLGIKKGLVECSAMCVKSEVILMYLYTYVSSLERLWGPINLLMINSVTAPLYFAISMRVLIKVMRVGIMEN